MSFEAYVAAATDGQVRPYPYQTALATSGLPEVLRAPTGSGKALAAVLPWLYQQRIVLLTANCCGAQWTGLSACHCSRCHHTFTDVWAFDQHRRDGQCLNPADAGLVLANANGDWPGWQNPDTRNGPTMTT